MDRKMITKLLAAMLAVTLMFSNVALLGIELGEVYAASTNLEEQSAVVNKANIEFDAYFLEEGGNTHTKDVNIAENQEKLYLRLKVSEGYLANATIKLQNANFRFAETNQELEYVESIDTQSGIITLNRMNRGESVIIELPIIMNTDSAFDVNSLTENSKLLLEGIYVNNQGNDREISKEIEVKANITSEVEANLTQEVYKYVQFDENGKNGVILQTSIKSKIKDNVLPVKQTELQIEIPEINGVAPSTVAMTAISTEGTNGGKTKVYSEEDYTYQDGKVTLIIENNPKEDGTIAWLKDVQDELLLTCVYGEDAISRAVILNLNAESKITMYNNEMTEVTASSNEQIVLEEEIGEAVSFDIKMDETELPKGYMLVPESGNTSFVQTLTANIGNRELANNVIFTEETNYLDENENEYPSLPIYKYTKIDRDNLVAMLGEDGYINIYNKDGEIITTLNKDNTEFIYEEETTYVRFETSKPLVEGIIEIENGKEIKPAEYDREQVQMFNKIKMTANGTAMYENQTVYSADISKDLNLVEPKTTVDASINQTSLSTVEKNTGVEIKFVLNTSDITKSLYKNPRIVLEFPSYVTNFSDGKIGMLYNQGLRIGATSIRKADNGNIILDIPMEGEQTKFNDAALANGAVVVVYASLTVDELAPRIKDNIKVYVTNEYESAYEVEQEGIGIQNIEIEYAAQNKVLTRNTISGYNDAGEEIKAVEGEKAAVISPKASAKKATIKLDIVNSTEKNIKNVAILGRTPFEGNKTVESGRDLNSKFTANMVKGISATLGISQNEMKVYYSYNENANSNLSDGQNGWTASPEDVTKVRSYLIVLGDKELAIGNKMSFEYDVQIPENIGGELGTYSTFAVYYEEVTDVAMIATISNNTKVSESGVVGLVTEKIAEISTPVQEGEPTQGGQLGTQAPTSEITADTFDASEIEVNVVSSTAGEELASGAPVKEGQYVDYLVTLTNKSETKDLVFDLVIGKENGTFYGLKVIDRTLFDEKPVYGYGEFEEDTITERITLPKGETTTYKYCLIADKDTENQELTSKVSIKQNETTIGEAKTTTNHIQNGDIKLNITYNKPENATVYTNGPFPVVITVSNIAGHDLQDVKVNLELQGRLFYQENQGYAESSRYDNVEVDEENRNVTFTINELGASEEATIYVMTKVWSLEYDVASEEGMIMASATIGDTHYDSNIYTKEFIQGEVGLTATMSGSVVDQYVEDGDEIIYTIEMDMTGVYTEKNLEIVDALPFGLQAIDYTVIDGKGEETTHKANYNTLTIGKYEIEPNGHITVKIRAKVVEKQSKSGIIENTAKITGNYIEGVTTNPVIYTIREKEEEEPDTPTPSTPSSTPSTPSTPESTPSSTPGSTPSSTPSGSTPSVPGGEGTNPGVATHSISGIVWLDMNKDGKRDTSEVGQKGINVRLMNNDTQEFVKDSKGKELSAVTGEDGMYTFNGLSAGSYLVVFVYDTKVYKPTAYQASDVSNSRNSDAIAGSIMMNGVNTEIAVTDIINITGSDKDNIDLGLVLNNTFDLKLDKVVSTVIVQNKQGTKTFTFKNDKLAKVEIPSKYIVGSNLTVEYKITVTNEGDVPGTASKIVDYLPNDMEFSSEINNEWYKDTDGNIYTNELENQVINPGETKEVTLVLTKKLKEQGAEMSSNSAEIVESYNSLGLEDVDSIAGNKAQKEDDQSSADLLTAVKTGAITYTLIALGIAAVIAGIAAGIYFIKKKVLNTNI